MQRWELKVPKIPKRDPPPEVSWAEEELRNANQASYPWRLSLVFNLLRNFG
jgi:hypothetical protein